MLDDCRLNLLLGHARVGKSIARRLLERFETIEAILTASEEELMEVPWIGPVRARLIREQLRAPLASPHSDRERLVESPAGQHNVQAHAPVSLSEPELPARLR